MLCMGKIPAGGAPLTLKPQRCDGGVGSMPFRWAVCVRVSSSLCSSALRVCPRSMFPSHDEEKNMPLNEQGEPEYRK